MAALTQPARVLVRAAVPGEGGAVAALWRELWDAHEAWGGYPGSRDARVYAQLARRLDEDARARAGHHILGRHVHLVAQVGGAVCGQVEGWFERHGIDAATPHTCEVRSLIVTERARGLGAGRALLDTLARTARKLSRGTSSVLAAEVLDRNPARAF
jgi:GNAT superfamily N-acetyltransferase